MNDIPRITVSIIRNSRFPIRTYETDCDKIMKYGVRITDVHSDTISSIKWTGTLITSAVICLNRIRACDVCVLIDLVKCTYGIYGNYSHLILLIHVLREQCVTYYCDFVHDSYTSKSYCIDTDTLLIIYTKGGFV